jgi:hypothetical protein
MWDQQTAPNCWILLSEYGIFAAWLKKNENIKRRDRLSYDITDSSASGHTINRILLLFSPNRVLESEILNVGNVFGLTTRLGAGKVQQFEVMLSLRRTLFDRKAIPLRCDLMVLSDALPVFINGAKLIGCCGESVLGSEAQPV